MRSSKKKKTPKGIVFIDTEVSARSGQALDFGAVKADDAGLHTSDPKAFARFLSGASFICGHNIYGHDLKYIQALIPEESPVMLIDTLYLSPLLFPRKPYHALLKDDKLQVDDSNNPLNDAIKAKELLGDELKAFNQLSDNLKSIYYSLLRAHEPFAGFFDYARYNSDADAASIIKTEFSGLICDNAGLRDIIASHPVELAYCLALIKADDRYSLTPPWVYRNFPFVENIITLLRNTPCGSNCAYCDQLLDARGKLKSIFGYDEFRVFDGEPLQENAVIAAINNRSMLVVFPTAGGKSLTFQLPAMIAGETVRGLTVIISPLQSLMKDQVDNLSALGLADAVTINGLLSPIERAEAIERVNSGLATILYISPESLRSKTIERLLLSRNIARFVIDEAHCFSSWGQDFRVDYLYIGEFIRELRLGKKLSHDIPVSCFTATAKQKVISDIKDYFARELNIELDLFTTRAERSNLRYEVLYRENDNEKYDTLRSLIVLKDCPTIVYVSRTKRAEDIADRLAGDGLDARPFHGQMSPVDKIAIQDSFISGATQIIVATSAFGMGVDKRDIKLIVHYDISDSLENYVQESGRAGRDAAIQAECYVLYNDDDLDKHFILLNQTKLSLSEIQQVWRAIKELTRTRKEFQRSPLEIARQAGWDEGVYDVETRVKTAIAALETAGYIKRGMNVPRVYATGISAANMDAASSVIQNSNRFNERQKLNASRIMKFLISSRSRFIAGEGNAESRVDYIADNLGLPLSEVVEAVNLAREEGLLAHTSDMSAYIRRGDGVNQSLSLLKDKAKLEEFMIASLSGEVTYFNFKEVNGNAEKAGIKNTSVKAIKNLLYYWTIQGYIRKPIALSIDQAGIYPITDSDTFKRKYEKRVSLASFIVEYLYYKAYRDPDSNNEQIRVPFSVLELKAANDHETNLFFEPGQTTQADIEEALLYLSTIHSLTLEGGFLVLYNSLEIRRVELNNRIQYKSDDYRQLNEFYKQKIQQIHIVGEYANMMVRDYSEAVGFVADYFNMDYRLFIAKYFKGKRSGEINRNITPQKYEKIFGGLSDAQKDIVNDDFSDCIVVAAGPGSGKTRALVHKLASIIILEDVKYEQLLMLTFSRAAAVEFKSQLEPLIGNAVRYVEIKTFHSYCFDLLGRVGNLDEAGDIVKKALEKIKKGEVENSRVSKTVVVIDEAQDMDENEFNLLRALIAYNVNMRVIAVGDDDQNIFEFRGSDSKYLKSLITDYGAKKYDLLENYRSRANIVALANAFAGTITERIKKQPIISVSRENGIVEITKHASKNLEIPLINNIKGAFKGGTAGVLTNTNDEALRITGLLIREGLRARLIQSNEGFDLYDLSEFRCFLKATGKDASTPFISDSEWNEGIERLKKTFSQSACLGACLDLLDDFERQHEAKYKNDLEIFIREAQLEDYFKLKQDEIAVSTIHKAKGREYDSVFMMLNATRFETDADRRKVYVGITRAKQELYIHYNGDCLDGFILDDVKSLVDHSVYPRTEEITLQLSHRDVFLGFFKGKSALIGKLRSGSVLSIKENSLYAELAGAPREVLRFSRSFQQKIEELRQMGYQPDSATVRYSVFWKGQDDTDESIIILPDVCFRLINQD